MNYSQPNGSRRVQSALQLLLSRAQSSISNVASTAHLHDLEQIAHRGLPLTADDLVSLSTGPAHVYSCFPFAA